MPPTSTNLLAWTVALIQTAWLLIIVGLPPSLLCSHSRSWAQESAPGAVPKESLEYAYVVRFISVPPEALPDHVRLVEQIRTVPLIPVTRNPDVLVGPERFKLVAMFFGMSDKSDLDLVRAGIVAIYQEKDPANEIGVYGLYFSNKKAAGRWFNKLTKNKKDPPFFLKGALLMYVWKDDSVSKSSFDVIRNYFKAAKFKSEDRERNPS